MSLNLQSCMAAHRAPQNYSRTQGLALSSAGGGLVCSRRARGGVTADDV